MRDTYYGAFHPIGICIKDVGRPVNKKADASVQEVFYDISYHGQLHHLTPSGVGTLRYKRHVDWLYYDEKKPENSAYEDSCFEDAEWEDGKMIIPHSRVMTFSAPAYQGKGEMPLRGNIPMPMDPDKIPGLCDIHRKVNRTPIIIE